MHAHLIARVFPKCVGKTGTNLIWSNLSILTAEQLGYVACVSPISVVKYLFANSVPVDNMLFDFEGAGSSHLDANNDGHNFT